MSDLLKEAIADAKAVRETALQNAKMALEEAFTPQLKSMLSAKLREDEDVEEDDDMEEDEVTDEGYHEDEEVEEDDEMEDEVPMGDDEMEDEVPMGDDEMEDEVPMVDDEMEDEDEDDDEDELDLEAIIRELEHELTDEDDEVEEDDEMEEDDEVEEDDDEFEVDESLFKEDEEVEEDEDEEVEESKMANELKEYKKAVKFLKNKLHEVNILNAKLLFTNKLFKEFALTNDQKMRVVETFDRAVTTREIKIVYSTLAESYKSGNIRRKIRIKESASSSVGTTKPSKQSRKVISEEAQVAGRFKKLAGII